MRAVRALGCGGGVCRGPTAGLLPARLSAALWAAPAAAAAAVVAALWVDVRHTDSFRLTARCRLPALPKPPRFDGGVCSGADAADCSRADGVGSSVGAEVTAGRFRKRQEEHNELAGGCTRVVCDAIDLNVEKGHFAQVAVEQTRRRPPDRGQTTGVNAAM